MSEVKAPPIEPIIRRSIWDVLLPYDSDEPTILWMSGPLYEDLIIKVASNLYIMRKEEKEKEEKKWWEFWK